MEIISLGNSHVSFHSFDFSDSHLVKRVDETSKLKITRVHKNFRRVYNKKILYSKLIKKNVIYSIKVYYSEEIIARFDKPERVIDELQIQNFEKTKTISIHNMRCTVKNIMFEDGIEGKSTILLSFESMDLIPAITIQ